MAKGKTEADTGKPVEFTETDNAALAEADKAGMTSPAGISPTNYPDLEEIRLRLEIVENTVKQLAGNPVQLENLANQTGIALVLLRYLFQTFHRTVDLKKLIANANASLKL